MGVFGVVFGCRGDGGFNGCCLGASIGDGGFMLARISGCRGVVGFNGCCLGASIGDGGFMLACISGCRGVVGFNGCCLGASSGDGGFTVVTWLCPVREIVRPASPKWPKNAVFRRAGRVFSRKCRRRPRAGRIFRGEAGGPVWGESFAEKPEAPCGANLSRISRWPRAGRACGS